VITVWPIPTPTSFSGTVVDDEMGSDVRVTVIAAGFDRWTVTARWCHAGVPTVTAEAPIVDVFADSNTMTTSTFRAS
jgi:cell division GTPase FtsZ